MAKFEIPVILLKDESDRDVLVFNFDDGNKIIDLNSDKQDSLEGLFYKIIELALKGEISFSLSKDGYDEQLFIEIAEEYLKKLETEISEIRTNLPEELEEC